MESIINYCARPTKPVGVVTSTLIITSNVVSLAVLVAPFIWNEACRWLLEGMRISPNTEKYGILAIHAQAPGAWILAGSVTGLLAGCIGLRSASWWKRWAIAGAAGNAAMLAVNLYLPA